MGKQKLPQLLEKSANTILIPMSWHYLFYLYPAVVHCHLHTKLLMPDDAIDNSKRTPRDVVLSMWPISTGGYCSHGWCLPKCSSPPKWRSSLSPKFVIWLFSWASGKYSGSLEYNSNFLKLNSSFSFFLQNIQGLTRNVLE